jgi:hypothetical protein
MRVHATTCDFDDALASVGAHHVAWIARVMNLIVLPDANWDELERARATLRAHPAVRSAGYVDLRPLIKH